MENILASIVEWISKFYILKCLEFLQLFLKFFTFRFEIKKLMFTTFKMFRIFTFRFEIKKLMFTTFKMFRIFLHFDLKLKN
jgi:hypothetical protein